ncbi:hypothetical protein KGY79_11085, partial [Candidatus Bipolaricaulota bacterium]|nr:hypothetical protein [Candidatus Bipolaricaulota bacterium]
NISSGKSAMMKLSLDRNKAFSKLPSDLYIDYNSEEINLEGVEGNTINSKTDFVTLNPNLTSGKLTPGYHEGEATLRAKNSRVKVNCKEETTVPYAFNLIRVGAGNKDEKLNVAFDNLSKTPGGSYEITKILNIQGLPDQWEDWGSLKVYQKESPQNMDMQQSITAEGNLKLTFSFPESSIGSLRAKLANSSLDAVLQFKFSPSQRGGVFNILESNSINLDFTVKDIGVSIGSCQGEGSLHFQSSEKTNNNWVFGYGSIEPRDSLFCLSVDYSNDISKSNRQLTIENKPMGIELVNSDGEKIAGSTSLEHIRVKAGEIDSGHYKGALKFTSKNDSITINYLKAPLSIRNEFTIPYIISVEPSSFNLQNLWGWSLDGDTRSVKREISLEGKWGLPEEGTISTSLKGLKGLTTKLSPYVQPNSFEPKPTQDIEIGLVGFPVERAFRQEEGKLQGSVVLHSKNPLVQFENRSIPFPLKLQRPSITVASTPSKPTDLGEKKEGEKVFSITVDYDELYQNLNLPPGIQYKIMPDNRDVFEVKQEGNDFSFYVKDDLSLDQETNFSGKVEFTPDEAARGITTLNGSLGKKQKSYSFAVNPAKVVVKSSKLKSGKMEPGSQLGEIEFSLTDQNLDAQETVLSYELTSDNLNASVEGSTIVLNGSKAEGNTGQLKLGSPGEESHVVRVTLADNLTGGLTGKDYQVAIDLNAPEGALIENIDGEKRKTVTLSTTLSIPGFLAALFWWVGIISLIVVAIYVVFIFSVSLMKKKLPNRVVVSQVYDKGIWVVGLLVVFLSLTVLSFLAKWLLLPLI